MSLLDFFKSSPAAGDGNVSANAGQNVEQKDLGDPNKTTNADGKMPGTGVETPVNPLDVYAKMFENAAKSSDIQAPEFKLDPTVLNDVSSKMDFTKGVNQEDMQKALSGDAQALLKVIQNSTQQAYKAALEHSTTLTDTFVKTRGEFEKKQVAGNVRTQLTDQALSSAPNYDHPVIRNELNRVASQMAKANPDASPQEIAKAAQKYINDLASALNPSAQQDPSKTAGEFDWASYLTKS
jgi:hypothetical protein